MRHTQTGNIQEDTKKLYAARAQHVHGGNYIWLFTSFYQQPPFLIGEYFKAVSQQGNNGLLSSFQEMIVINPTTQS